jgi:hypothetical protein
MIVALRSLLAKPAAGEVSTGRPVEAASTLWWKMELAGKMSARNALFPLIAKEISRVAWTFVASRTTRRVP